MKIVIVGGGFGGVRAARQIAKYTKHQVTLISDQSEFQYYPAMYGAATGRSSQECWFSLATLFADVPRVRVVIDRVVRLESAGRYVMGKSGQRYDYQRCILALGSVTNYFGIKGLEEFSFGIKSRSQIDEFKHHLYQELKAGRDRSERNIVVVGGGPTGVELAASLGSYLRQVEKRLDLRKQSYQVHLVEAMPNLLPSLTGKAGQRAQKRLASLGVAVRLNTKLKSVSKTRVLTDQGAIKSRTTVWTAGVAPSSFYQDNKSQFDFSRRGKIVVNDFMQASRYVYVIGDNAETPYSGLAQVATAQADLVASNLRRAEKNRQPVAFAPKNPPVVIPIGERYSLFSWGRFRMYGWLPALLRKAADIIGYTEILGLRRALAVSHWSESFEDEYFLLGAPGE